MQQEQEWFYVDQKGKNQGPFPPPEFKALADRGVIGGDTPVWSKGYPSWIPAGEVTGLVAPTKTSSAPDIPDPPGATPPEASAAVQVEVAGPQSGSAPDPQEGGLKPDPLPVEELKPRKGSFVFPRTMIGVVLVTVLTVVVSLGLAVAGISPFIGVLVFVSGVALVVYAALVAYRKERYELQDATVVCHRGGLVSDQTTELEIRNITHVKVKLPWLRHKLFGVGNVLIESAGNAQPVVLQAIRKPEEIYAQMSERMKLNGYDLSQEQLLHEERPAMLGVLSECGGVAFMTFVALMFGFPTILTFSEAMASAELGWIAWVLAPVFIVGALGFLVAHFLDLQRRTYRVFNDVVVYEEGFLTRENAFIPYENIADAATKRSFFDQILNLFDVLVSCQGSASEIKFRRLQHGVQLSACIDRLVLEAGRKRSLAEPAGQDDAASPASQFRRRDEPELVSPSEAWIADLRMSPARVFVPLLLLLPLVPIWIAAMIQAAIKLWSTRYAVRPGSIRHSYRFLTTSDREFAYDKITGLVIKENLWDRLFSTVTLRFWSIGSGRSLELAHVSRRQIDFEALGRQIGIPAASAQPCEVATSFGALTWLRARCWRLGFALLAVVGLAVAGMQTGEEFFYWLIAVPAIACLAGFGYAWTFFSRQRLRFHDHHVEAEQGIITRLRYYALYRNVKKSKVIRYPGGHQGSLQIFVAGEQQKGQQAEKKGQVKIAVPCSFTLGFLPQAMEKGQLLDDILCGRVDPGPETTPGEPLELLMETRRAVGNSVLMLILCSVLIFPLIVLLPITLPLTIYAMKQWRYRVDVGRVIVVWGILFKKQVSIILNRVDSLQQQQGPLNKLFKNGNVSIMTAGSSKPDLVMPASPDYQELYREIRKRSQGS